MLISFQIHSNYQSRFMWRTGEKRRRRKSGLSFVVFMEATFFASYTYILIAYQNSAQV
jgi:hypothetical protein